MNFIDACGVLADSAELRANDVLAHEAREVIRAVVDAYDSLEPTAEMWTDAPSLAMWYAIDAIGEANWYEDEPEAELWRWGGEVGWSDGDYVTIPEGIDWRLCKWQRPDSL